MDIAYNTAGYKPKHSTKIYPYKQYSNNGPHERNNIQSGAQPGFC